MSLLSIPNAPQKILANKTHNTQESQLMSEGNHIYFVDRYEYPESGGILVYKYGGIVKPVVIDQSKYEESGQKCLEELRELLKRHDFDLTGQDRQPVMLIPNEVIRLENAQQVEERIDLKHPEKGIPDPLAVSLANKVKRVLKEEILFFSYKWTIVAFSAFIFLPFKYKIKILERWLDGWSGYGMLVMEPRLMEVRYYTEFCRALYRFVNVFLKTLGVSQVVADRTAWVVAEILERDNAYRWRAEDVLTETSVEKLLKQPQKEVDRLIGILLQRELKSAKLPKTFKSFARILKFILRLPRFKKAWGIALKEVNFKDFQFDEIDRHQVMKYGGYNFFGIPVEAREQAWKNLYNGKPPKMVHVQA